MRRTYRTCCSARHLQSSCHETFCRTKRRVPVSCKAPRSRLACKFCQIPHRACCCWARRVRFWVPRRVRHLSWPEGSHRDHHLSNNRHRVVRPLSRRPAVQPPDTCTPVDRVGGRCSASAEPRLVAMSYEQLSVVSEMTRQRLNHVNRAVFATSAADCHR